MGEPIDVSPRPPVQPTYLGDGVYAEFDGFNVWVWTTDGINKSQKIALEPAVIDALIAYGRRCGTVR